MSTTFDEYRKVKDLIVDGARAGVLSDMCSIMDYIEANNREVWLHLSNLQVRRILQSLIRDGGVFWSGCKLSVSSHERARRVPYGFKTRMDRDPVKGTHVKEVFDCSRCSRQHSSDNMAVWFDSDVCDLSCPCDKYNACARCAEERVHFNPSVATVSVELATFDTDDLCEVGSPTKPLCMFCAIDFDSTNVYECDDCEKKCVGKDRLGVVVTPQEGGDERRWEHPSLAGKTCYVDTGHTETILCVDCCAARLFGTDSTDQ